jgi:hypothetical protein
MKKVYENKNINVKFKIQYSWKTAVCILFNKSRYNIKRKIKQSQELKGNNNKNK